jgi:ABC-type multidrug transport system ATPase subunit
VVPDLEDAVIALTLERTTTDLGDPARAASPTPSGQATESLAVRDPRPLVVVSSVVRQYGAFRAVDDVSLTVAPGQVVGLLGANGAGKTTVIRTILGLEAPDGGEVRLFGGLPSRDARRRLGYVPQGLGLAVQLSVRENAQFVAAAYGLREVPVLPDALAEVADRLVGAIGLGRQRQLAFWAALAHRPEVLVLDEPTSGVDPVARAALWDMVHAQAEAGVAVLVTTHYMQEAEQCDDLVMLSRGRRVASGSLPELLASACAVEVRTDHWQEVFAALTDAGLPVTVAGRSVRVAGADARSVARGVDAVLAASGLNGQVLPVAATLEEVMVLVETASGADPGRADLTTASGRLSA